jgi:dipeptidyl aminopeptidase/acylaminoacyl peptidase
VTGEAVLVAETVARIEGAAIGLFSVSPSGVLAYHSDWIPEKTVLAWFNRTGMRVGTLGAPGVHISVELAPNGAAAAVVRTDDVANEDVWVYDIRGDAAPTRLTVDRGNDIEPIWSPDSTRLAFTKGLMQTTIHVHSVTGGRQAALSERDTHSMVTGDWASDGQHIVGFSAIDKGGDLWLLPLEGGTAARPLRQTPFREWQPDITSDGRWIAYSSDESGRQEIWVARFPDGGRKRQVSAAGGSFPEWNAAGNELFYLDENNVVNAVSVKIEGDGLSVSSPKPLFQTRARFGWTDPFAVSPDGQRFLVNTVDVPVAPTPVTVVVGWPSEVAKRRQR